MAIAVPAPDTEPAPAPIEDPITFEEAAILFKQTGGSEFAVSLKRVYNKLYMWARRDGIVTRKRWDGKVEVSYTDLLEAHNRRYPAPSSGFSQ